MKKRTSFVFLLSNFAITWGLWVTVILILGSGKLEEDNPIFILYVLGGLLGPVIAALIAKRVTGNGAEFRLYLRSLIKVRIHVKWYLYVLVVPLIITFLPRVLAWIFTGTITFSTNDPIYMALLALPTFIIGGGLEELGWRGVFLPELLKRYSLFQSTILLIPIWAVWHLPLWFMNGTAQYGSNFGLFVISVGVISLFLSILYMETKSIFLCIIFHAFMNSFGAIVGDVEKLSSTITWTIALIKLLICFSIFLWYCKSRKLLFAAGKIAHTS